MPINFKHDITFWVSTPLIPLVIITAMIFRHSIQDAEIFIQATVFLVALVLILCLLEVLRLITMPRLWIGGCEEPDPQSTFFFLLDEIDNYHSWGDKP